MNARKLFASDNNSGAHHRILAAVVNANDGSATSYGTDPWTEKAISALQEAFGSKARPWFVFLGTAANVLGLKTMVPSHKAILCAADAHIHCDECGSLEAIAGSKIVASPSINGGKIDLEACERALFMREAVHHSYPAVISITQSTECGTVYSIEELRTIRKFCDKHTFYLHMDGARLANAAAFLGTSLKAMTTDIGVDVVTFGGTKNGLMFGEAIIFLNDALGHEFSYVRKQHMQLVSKMRFMSAQFLEYLKDELWRENALAANGMAKLLADEIAPLEWVRFAYPVEANVIFARMPQAVIAKLEKQFYFYTIDPHDAEGFPKGWPLVRLMTSFDTTEEQVREFAAAIKEYGNL